MKVKIKKVERILDDFFKVDRAILQFEKFDGSMSPEIVRLNFDRGDSVGAIIYHATNRSLIFVRQFRYPIFTKDPENAWSLEIVAGVIDAHDSPQDAMAREIREEIGYQVQQLKPVFSFYATPGGSNEKVFLFFAIVTDQDRLDDGGGVVEEGENLQILEIPVKTTFEMLNSGEFYDAKTIIALQWLKNRQRLLK